MSGFRGGITGESFSAPLKVRFDRRLKLQFHGAKLSSNGGLIVFRELDDALGLTEMASWELRDNRTGKNSRHNLLAMFRQSAKSPGSETLSALQLRKARLGGSRQAP